MIGSALDKYLTANPFVPSSHSNSSFAVTSAEAATSQVLTSDVSGSPGKFICYFACYVVLRSHAIPSKTAYITRNSSEVICNSIELVLLATAKLTEITN